MTVRYAYRAVYASKHMPGLFEKNLDSGPSFFFWLWFSHLGYIKLYRGVESICLSSSASPRRRAGASYFVHIIAHTCHAEGCRFRFYLLLKRTRKIPKNGHFWVLFLPRSAVAPVSKKANSQPSTLRVEAHNAENSISIALVIDEGYWFKNDHSGRNGPQKWSGGKSEAAKNKSGTFFPLNFAMLLLLGTRTEGCKLPRALPSRHYQGRYRVETYWTCMFVCVCVRFCCPTAQEPIEQYVHTVHVRWVNSTRSSRLFIHRIIHAGLSTTSSTANK